jgi:cobalt-zinc-cadmium efflux system outer membrane protein
MQATLRARLARAAGAVDAAAERVKIYGTHILPAFERNLEKIRRAYDLGELEIHQVSQIRERVLATQQEGLDALGDYYRAVAELEALLGTDIWPEAKKR